jgi:hypothetical protein
MNQPKTPSEKIVANPMDGKRVTDSAGRVLVLRKPDILDMYDLFSAIGDDTKNPACVMMATKVLYVATIDGQVVESPKSLSQFRATLKRVGESGLFAVDKALNEMDENESEKEMLEKAKKS